MRNISFDNPYLLLILIPLLALILVPIFIAIRKENNSKSVMASLILHIAIALCISLALGGMILTTVMTKTQVIVLADVSYSANRNLEEVDQYIRDIEDKLPRNSEMSVLVFAREYKVLTEMGEDLVSVKDHGFKINQTDATNISAAINHAVNLFDADVIKRIIVITDGKETRADAAGELAAAVDNAYANDIYIDAIYLDDNLKDGDKEVQITDVEFSPSVYKNQKATATIAVESTVDTKNAYIEFSIFKTLTKTMAVELHKGYQTFTFELPTGSSGDFDYRFNIRSDMDTATANNLFEFTQTVNENMRVLLVSWDEADRDKLAGLYPEGTQIDSYIQDPDVPCTVEQLCVYDEIVLSNFDVRDIRNYTSFIEAIDKVVSRYGKSLITMGDLRIQSKTDPIFQSLEDMLPVKFGNSDQDPKLYTIVLDVSRSMQNFSRLRIAKEAAIQLMNMLADEDYVMIVVFWGDLAVLQTPTEAANRDEIAELITNWEPKQGTMLGTALREAKEYMKDMPFSDKQVMLISDGMSYSLEEDNPVEIVKELRAYDITTSVIHPAGRAGEETSDSSNGDPTLLKQIAEAGGGKYFAIAREEDMAEIMFNDIQEDLTQSVMTGEFQVAIANWDDPTLIGVDDQDLPKIYGYAYAKKKASANTVLTVPYEKPSGKTVDVPLFAYWEYGNGRVSSFTSTFTGSWSSAWQDSESANSFFANMIELSTPEQRVDTPYSVNVTFDGTYSEVEIVPVTLNTKAATHVTVVTPDGTRLEKDLIFDSTRYFYSFETPTTGTYQIDVVYRYDEEEFTSTSYFSISYSPEYNLFAVFDPSDLHAAIRNRGTVYEGEIPSLKNDDKEVATYTIRLIAPLMILAAVLYVIDVIIRKLKISDIKSFFNIKPKRGVGK